VGRFYYPTLLDLGLSASNIRNPFHSLFSSTHTLCKLKLNRVATVLQYQKKPNQVKKIILMTAMIAAAVFSTSTSKAQDVTGKHFINAGIGIGTFGFSGTGGLPVTASYEHGFTDKISAGIYGGFIKRKWYNELTYNYKVIGARGSYHFNEILKIDDPKLDVYGGISIYYRGYVVKYDSPVNGKSKATSGGVDFGFHAGGRYMFSKNAGVFAELGYGVSPLQLGASFVF
jgi:hypothetical protein